jgi:hypothetical protein
MAVSKRTAEQSVDMPLRRRIRSVPRSVRRRGRISWRVDCSPVMWLETVRVWRMFMVCGLGWVGLGWVESLTAHKLSRRQRERKMFVRFFYVGGEGRLGRG